MTDKNELPDEPFPLQPTMEQIVRSVLDASGVFQRIEELERENERLREALDWALGYVESEYETTSGNGVVEVKARELRARLNDAQKNAQ